jgi:hypothetical protein
VIGGGVKEVKQTQWFDLGEGLRACIGPHMRPRWRRGQIIPPTWLVLGLRPADGSIRPLLCSGKWLQGVATIERGELGAELLDELERKIREITA